MLETGSPAHGNVPGIQEGKALFRLHWNNRCTLQWLYQAEISPYGYG